MIVWPRFTFFAYRVLNQSLRARGYSLILEILDRQVVTTQNEVGVDSIEINQLTLQALKQAMQQEGESRLVSAGKSKPGLIGGNATRERKYA